MSQGVYGTSIPATVDVNNDVEIWYNYRTSRTDDTINANEYFKLSPSLCLEAVKTNQIDYILGNPTPLIEGMYTLKLPLAEFSRKGFYSIYIKPKEIPVTIADIAPLMSFNDVKGIVINTEDIEDITAKTLVSTNNGLVGYRIVYIENGSRREDVRIVTSNNKVEPLTQSGGLGKTSVYRYNDTSSTVFITVTPSTSPSFKPNANPYIGTVGQQILLVNTKFEPIHLDIEMVENDADTIATLIAGDQLRSLDEGLLTTFNSSKEIVAQQEIYTLKDSTTGKPVYEVRKLKNDIDFSQELPD